MTAQLTIQLSDDILRALRSSKSITIRLGTNGAAKPGKPAKAARPKAPKSAGAVTTEFRAGSHPAKLLAYAQKRTRPFGVEDTAKHLKVKRAHASMVLTRLVATGHLKRAGRGAYVVA